MSTFLKRLLQTPREQRLAELKSLLSLWKYSVLYSVEGFILLHVISQYGFEIRVPFGISMQPTMAPDGEAIFIDKTSRRGRNVKVGDIVAFTHPVMETHAVKRIVALPGDFVLAGTPEAQGGSLEGMMIQVSFDVGFLFMSWDIPLGHATRFILTS